MRKFLVRQKNPSRPRYLLWVALLLVFALTGHALDSCVSHLSVPQPQSHCKNVEFSTDGDHGLPCCAHADLCEVTSEVSTAASQSFQIEAPALILSASVAPPLDFFILTPPVGATASRDGPNVASLASLCPQNTLSGRSPPFSA